MDASYQTQVDNYNQAAMTPAASRPYNRHHARLHITKITRRFDRVNWLGR